jgi:hypothetical protein
MMTFVFSLSPSLSQQSTYRVVMPVIPAFRRQEDGEFKACLGYLARQASKRTIQSTN